MIPLLDKGSLCNLFNLLLTENANLLTTIMYNCIKFFRNVFNEWDNKKKEWELEEGCGGGNKLGSLFEIKNFSLRKMILYILYI